MSLVSKGLKERICDQELDFVFPGKEIEDESEKRSLQSVD